MTMANWNLFNNYLTVNGKTKRDRLINDTQKAILIKSQHSPAYKTVLIDDKEQKVIITSSTELNTKKINALPNENIYAGSIVLWNKHHWIITEVDCEDDVYQRGKMLQCNVYLKWQNTEGKTLGRYGYAQNIAEFAAGVVENKIINSIQATHKIQLPMDEETILMDRGKRFLLDVFTVNPEAYIVTDRNVFSMNYDPVDIDENYIFNGRGKILQLTITQTQLSAKDNCQLMIADYFETQEQSITEAGSCNILYKGKPQVKLGGSFKTFTPEFILENGNKDSIAKPKWSFITLPEFQNKIIAECEDNKFKIKVPDIADMFHTQIKVILDDTEGIYHQEIYITVVNLYG